MITQRNRKLYSRFASFVLTLVLIVVLAPVSVKAADDYPYRGQSGVDPWNFYKGQCTSFVAWKLNNSNGVNFTNQYGSASKWGNAKTWGTVAQRLGIAVNRTPEVGSVAWWNNGTYGHVAWVSAVNGDTITVEEYNWSVSEGYSIRTLNKSKVTGGFIHIKDIRSAETPQTSSDIPNGTYNIIASNNFALDIENNSLSDGGNVLIWEWDANKNNQKFRIERQNDGTYIIYIDYSGKVIDIANQNTDNGTNIHQWSLHGGSTQKWYIVDVGGGYYKFVSQHSKKCLDVNGAIFNNGTNVQLWDDNGSLAQKFRLIPVGASVNEISNGTYYVKSAANPSQVLNVYTTSNPKHKNNVTLYPFDSNDIAQQWTFQKVGDAYKIGCVKSEVVLNVSSDVSAKDNMNVNVYKFNSADVCQLWILENVGDNKYIIRAKSNPNVVLTPSGLYKKVTDIKVRNYNGSESQKWYIDKI